jgi:hypothetical protein
MEILLLITMKLILLLPEFTGLHETYIIKYNWRHNYNICFKTINKSQQTNQNCYPTRLSASPFALHSQYLNLDRVNLIICTFVQCVLFYVLVWIVNRHAQKEMEYGWNVSLITIKSFLNKWPHTHKQHRFILIHLKETGFLIRHSDQARSWTTKEFCSIAGTEKKFLFSPKPPDRLWSPPSPLYKEH